MFGGNKKIVNRKKYIHYGSDKFKPELFVPVHNMGEFPKPQGGFWGSPVKCSNSWIDWVMDNEFMIDKYRAGKFQFKLSSDARILEITSSNQLKDLPQVGGDLIYDGKITILDFEKLKESYDAIEVSISSDYQLYWDLYGWDVDSILVMNPDVVVEV